MEQKISISNVAQLLWEMLWNLRYDTIITTFLNLYIIYQFLEQPLKIILFPITPSINGKRNVIESLIILRIKITNGDSYRSFLNISSHIVRDWKHYWHSFDFLKILSAVYAHKSFVFSNYNTLINWKASFNFIKILSLNGITWHRIWHQKP